MKSEVGTEGFVEKNQSSLKALRAAIWWLLVGIATSWGNGKFVGLAQAFTSKGAVWLIGLLRARSFVRLCRSHAALHSLLLVDQRMACCVFAIAKDSGGE